MILSITAPIFLLIGLGYGATRLGLTPQSLAPGLGRFVLFFTTPALIFRALSGTQIDQVIEPAFLFVYGASCLASFAILFALFRVGFRKTVTESAMGGFGASASNSIFVGFPILLQVFGAPPAAAFAMALLVENLLVIPLALVVMDAGTGRRGAITATLRTLGARLIRNPLLIAIAAGALASALALRPPEPIERIIGLLADASPAVALFYIGGVLVHADPRGRAYEFGAVATGKLIVHPALTAGLLLLVPGLAPDLRIAALIFAAAPMLAIYPIIGARYGLERESAATLLVTTAFAFATISGLLWMLE